MLMGHALTGELIILQQSKKKEVQGKKSGIIS
jgi:hypothetical protein